MALSRPEVQTRNRSVATEAAAVLHPYNGEWNSRSIWALTILTGIYTMNYLDRQILALVLPLIKLDLLVSDTSLGLITGPAFVLCYSLLGVPIARLADRSNRRNILAAGVAFWSVMTAATGLVRNAFQLAATRFLMGAGEATGIAPSTSISSDMFGREHRALAMSILTSGSLIASLLFPLIGRISQICGWRETFMWAGIPGFGLGLLLIFTIKEPARAAGPAKMFQEPFRAALGFLLASRAYLLCVAGGALMGVSLYAAQIWNPTFLYRVHHMNPTQVGAAIGSLRGAMGLVGAMLGGYLTNRLGKKNERWRLWLPGLACLLVFPCEALFLLSSSIRTALIGLALTGAFSAMHIGPVYAVCKGVARKTQRATAAAFFLLCANLCGQIVGPLGVGYLNDRWHALYGGEAIRYSLVLGASFAAMAGLLIVFGARTLPEDMARAES